MQRGHGIVQPGRTAERLDAVKVLSENHKWLITWTLNLTQLVLTATFFTTTEHQIHSCVHTIRSAQYQTMSRLQLCPSSIPAGTASYEAEHVHKVYEIIAPHFSATRFKVVSPGSLGYFSLVIYREIEPKYYTLSPCSPFSFLLAWYPALNPFSNSRADLLWCCGYSHGLLLNFFSRDYLQVLLG